MPLSQSPVQALVRALRSMGPYLLIELLLPGGTLVAVLLWLTQNAAKRPSTRARLPASPRGVAATLLKPRQRNGPSASALLSFQQKAHDLGNDRGGAAVELVRREVRDRVRHRDEFEVRQTPRARHRRAGRLEHVRDDRCGRYAVLFEHDAVEDTPRRA